MKYKILFITTLLINNFINYVNAQNSRFSQIYSAPVMLNPALSGRYTGNGRVGTLISWQNSTTTSIAHQNIYADFKLINGKYTPVFYHSGWYGETNTTDKNTNYWPFVDEKNKVNVFTATERTTNHFIIKTF